MERDFHIPDKTNMLVSSNDKMMDRAIQMVSWEQILGRGSNDQMYWKESLSGMIGLSMKGSTDTTSRVDMNSNGQVYERN